MSEYTAILKTLPIILSTYLYVVKEKSHCYTEINVAPAGYTGEPLFKNR